MRRLQSRRKVWYNVDATVMLKAGTRSSNLAIIQTASALNRLQGVFPKLEFEMTPLSSPGDRDLKTDLRCSDPDFFTRDLDEAIIKGEIDCAVHSAKDLPEQLRPELDFFLLPWKEDPRDVLIFSHSYRQLPHDKPVIGVSSERREEFCRRRFPEAKMKAIRGDIETRLQQLDAGEFDIVIMAAAALKRLDLTERIDEWIALADLPAPERQGVLAITFSVENKFMRELARFFRQKHSDPCCLCYSNVLLTCSEHLLEKSIPLVKKYRGVPALAPMIRLVPEENVFSPAELTNYDRIVLTSPTAVEIFTSSLEDGNTLPPIAACGPGTAETLERKGFKVDISATEKYGSEGLIGCLEGKVKTGEKILRLCSDQSSKQITIALDKIGAEVEERILYRNVPVKAETLPEFDAVFFASSSAVNAFIDQWGYEMLEKKEIIAIGKPTFTTICEKMPNCHAIMASKSTVKGMIAELAALLNYRERLFSK